MKVLKRLLLKARQARPQVRSANSRPLERTEKLGVQNDHELGLKTIEIFKNHIVLDGVPVQECYNRI